jgi:DNA-binding FadR family transcriptional regulator
MTQTPPAVVADIRPNYLVDQVIAALQAALEQGVYKPGDKLPAEAELGRQFKVGRSTIREALRVLSHLGLVETWTGRGTFVVHSRVTVEHPGVELQPEQVEDLWRFRFTLEIEAARRAARRRTPEQMAAIREALQRTKRALKSGNMDGIISADLDMHIAILEAAGDQFAVEVYRANRAKIEQASRALIGVAGQLRTNSSQDSADTLHDELVAAIENGDATAAAAAVKRDRREAEVRMRLLVSSG